MKAKTHTLLVVVTFIGYWFGLCNASAFYDPGAQRWLNRDPLGEKDGINLSEFAENNSLNIIDISGLSPFSYFKKHAKCSKAMKDWKKKCEDNIPKDCPQSIDASEDAFNQAEFYTKRMDAIHQCALDSEGMFKKCMEAAYEVEIEKPPFSWPPKGPKPNPEPPGDS